jgi:hypothetical protein
MAGPGPAKGGQPPTKFSLAAGLRCRRATVPSRDRVSGRCNGWPHLVDVGDVERYQLPTGGRPWRKPRVGAVALAGKPAVGETSSTNDERVTAVMARCPYPRRYALQTGRCDCREACRGGRRAPDQWSGAGYREISPYAHTGGYAGAATPQWPDESAPAGHAQADGNVGVPAALLHRDGLDGIWSLSPEHGSARRGAGKRGAKHTGLPAKTASFAMRDIELLTLARDLRAGAREMSSRAEAVYDTDTEQRMRAVAACHEKLARRDEHDSVGFNGRGHESGTQRSS